MLNSRKILQETLRKRIPSPQEAEQGDHWPVMKLGGEESGGGKGRREKSKELGVVNNRDILVQYILGAEEVE